MVHVGGGIDVLGHLAPANHLPMCRLNEISESLMAHREITCFLDGYIREGEVRCLIRLKEVSEVDEAGHGRLNENVIIDDPRVLDPKTVFRKGIARRDP